MKIETIDRLGRAVALAKIIEMAAEGSGLDREARGALSSAAGNLVDELKSIEDDATADDFSIKASTTSHQAVLRDVVKLKDMIADLSPGAAQAEMLRLIENLNSWFMNGVDRLAAMQTAREAESP